MSLISVQSPPAVPEPRGLLKETLADELRRRILNGDVSPGERIVEGRWARELSVAQASVREAIHILIAEGFLQKKNGRSARVTEMTDADVLHIYQVRAALEGLAAGLIARRQEGVDALDRAVQAMREAAEADDMQRLLKADLDFHLTLCRRSGNPYLYEQAKRLLRPMFAFTQMRTKSGSIGPASWSVSIGDHQRIVDVIRQGDPFFAQHYVAQVMDRFEAEARTVWAPGGGVSADRLEHGSEDA